MSLFISLFLLSVIVRRLVAVTWWTYFANLPFDFRSSPVAILNDTIFLFQAGSLTYSPFIFDVVNWNKVSISTSIPLNWTTIPLPTIPNDHTTATCCNALSQSYTQIDNFIYAQVTNNNNDQMIIFDLASLSFIDMDLYDYVLPLKYFDCFVNNHTHLFLFGGRTNQIWMYNIANNKWIKSNATFDRVLQGQACAISQDLSKIFAFGGSPGSATVYSNIYEYNVKNDSLILLTDVILNNADTHKQAVTTWQDMIYVIDGYQRATGQIFDMKNKNFKTNCVLQMFSYTNSFFYSKYNVLITTGDRGTETTRIRYLPIDLEITFDFNIFNYGNIIIHPGVNNTIECIENIQIAPIIISTNFSIFDFHLAINNDGECVLCDEVQDCVGCYYRVYNTHDTFDTVDTFSISANKVYAIATICKFNLYLKRDVFSYGENELVLGYDIINCDYSSIAYSFGLEYNIELILNKESVSQTATIYIINDTILPIIIRWEWPFDALQNGSNTINIISNDIAIQNTFFVSHICDVIDFSSTNAKINHDGFFIIKYEILHKNICQINNTKFQIELISRELNFVYNIIIFNDQCTILCIAANQECGMCNHTKIYVHVAIDNESVYNSYKILLYSTNVHLLYNEIEISVIPKAKMSPDSPPITINVYKKYIWSMYMLIAIVCVVLIAILLFVLYRKKMKRDREKLAIYLKNPMVITIGIGDYFKKDIWPTLDVDLDVANLALLFEKRLNYKSYPPFETRHNIKLKWTQKELMQFLFEKAKQFNESDHDGLVAILTGHGIKDYIITSDGKAIQKIVIHRIFSHFHSKKRDCPRVFIFDACDGDKGHKQENQPPELQGARCINNDDFEEKKEDNIDEIHYLMKHNIISGKVINMDFIEKLSRSDEVWNENEHNPDYKLCTVFASNSGYKALANTVTGSYLTTEFVKRMIKNIKTHKNKYFLFEVLDNIQSDLHSEGKQLAVTTFNNNTRYLKFIQNKQNNINYNVPNEFNVEDLKEDINDEDELEKMIVKYININKMQNKNDGEMIEMIGIEKQTSNMKYQPI
eukprot:108584_1